MTFFASPAFFPRVLRIAALLFMLLPGISPSALAALPRNSEISIIMKERAAVEQNLSSLKRQLQEYQAKLQSTSRKESQSFKVLENIRTQILVLEKMIAENQNYLKKLDGNIARLRHELQGNRQIYGRVSDDFRRTAVSAYKYGGNRDREHLFASGSVSKALVRAQYMGFFTRAVRNNVDTLQTVAVKLENSRLALEQSYKQKAEMVKEQERQLKSWASRKNEKEMVLERLKKNKQEYLLQLASVQKKRTQLQSRIESLILAEQRALEAERDRQRKILEARRLRQRLQTERLEADRIRLKKEKPAKIELAVKQKTAVKSPEKESVPSSPKVDFSELDGVSADFDKALGSLPWPVRNGVVSQRFGSVEDKDLKIVRTNNGIDISVPVSTQVRAVSGGKVVQIAFLPTFGNIVIIRHPKSYLTVYANLGQLNIVKDELIKSQQLLGVSGKTPEGTSIVHFEIWKGRVKQNPAKWLR
ncbi:MAG: peptidoglycan DD-metalloendopeptidase family protein [Chlorobium sp.]|nr:peptidoglycan DD-metalloendopeptidase family protein [Chlorobium sp.]